MHRRRLTLVFIAVISLSNLLIGTSSAASAQETGQRLINEKRVLNEFLEMVQIRSQGKNERQLADILKDRLKEMGAEVSEDNAYTAFGGNTGNIFAFFKGTVHGSPVLMLNSHIDTVEPSAGVVPQIVDGVIKPSGKTILGADDKAGVASILEAMRTVREKNIPYGDILVLFTVAEDVGLLGSKAIDKNRLQKADFGFSLDSAGRPGDIYTSAPGSNRISIVIHGKASHAGVAPEKGINAIVIAGKALAGMQQGRIDAETTSNVGMIQGGTAINIVPDRVEVQAGVRSRDQAKLDYQTKYMTDTFMNTAIANGGRCDVNVASLFAAFKLDASSTPVQVAEKAMSRLGLPFAISATGGGSDANYFNAYGVPVAILAVGYDSNHTSDEHITVDDLYKSANLAVALIQVVSEMKK
jgi:tripeptide aminopeptidase